MVNAPLTAIIESMRGVYKSIDLRIAIILIDDKWHNVLTLIRFSHENLEGIKKKYESLKSKWRPIKGDEFRIICKAFNINEWDNLLHQFSKGKIIVNDLEVKFDGNKDLSSLRSDLHGYPTYSRKTDEWSTFGGILTTSNNTHQFLRKVERDVRLLGFPSIYTAINEWLQTRYNHTTSLDVFVSAPIYAIIKDIDYTEQKVEVSIKFHSEMHGLRLNAILWKSRGFWGDNYEKTEEIKELAYVDIDIKKSTTKGEFSYFKWNKEFPNAQPIDYLDVRLIYTPLMTLEIGKRDQYLSRYLERKSPAKTPFFSTFNRFCSQDDFIKQLLEPRIYKTKGIGPDKIFERAVSWLLSLCGFNVIKLDEFEKLKVKGGKAEYDSVDLLAYDKEKTSLLLVSCTIGVPKVEEDISHLVEVKRRLFDELFRETNLQIIPVIFSSYRDLSLIKDAGHRSGIKIIDGNDIEKIMIEVRDGKLREVFNLLTSF